LNKAIIDYLVRLFAIIANLFPVVSIDNIKQFIRLFLKKDFTAQLINEYIILFENYYEQYKGMKNESKDSEFLYTILEQTTLQINATMPQKYRLQLVIRLLIFEKYIFKYFQQQLAGNKSIHWVLQSVAENFKINPSDFLNCKSFINEKLFDISNKKDLLVFGSKKLFDTEFTFIEKENIGGQIYFLHIANVETILFYYKGSENLKLNHNLIFTDNIYILNKGTVISFENSAPIYFNDILKLFLTDNVPKISIRVNNLEYRYRNSKNGVHNLSVTFNTGQLVGIIGRSGVGKSTLLNLLNGSLKPDKGDVLINHINLYTETKNTEGLIGFIPQDDLLIEELTVYENLFLNSQLCLGELTKDEINEKVNNLLIDLDLFDIRDLKTGSPLNKFISGGQRKRLNIALELIREPWILLADEPTSGLSSSDADEIMKLLTEQAIKGKIVIINIHQPSSDNFKLFDEILVLDKEGYTVYFGNPVDSITYFNETTGRYINSSDHCDICGNINHESVFRIIEEKKIDEFGNSTNERKVSPEEWNRLFIEKNSKPEHQTYTNDDLPSVLFKKPGKFKQFIIFSKRNFLSKISNNQYIFLSVLVSPVLALILSLLCRSGVDPYNPDSGYIFAFNKNIHAYLFMSVIVALFIGLIISAEEIFKDRGILKRESFLKLDKKSYLLSKIGFLFFLSLIQTFLYVSIGNFILEIKEMFLIYWLVLFATSFFANILGLLISTVFNSVIVIYILVPILIVPQLLLSGVVVQYDQLNKNFVSQQYTPIIGDIMASRWAYEALMVAQFKNNPYQKSYFDIEMDESNVKFDLIFLIPVLSKTLNEIMQDSDHPENSERINKITLLKNGLKKIDYAGGFKNINQVNPNELTNEMITRTENYLKTAKTYYGKRLNNLSIDKDKITRALHKNIGDNKSFNEFKNKHYNVKLAEIVLNRTNLETYTVSENVILRKIEPIYQVPDSKSGRAQFYSSTKKIGRHTMNTLAFNIITLWIMTIIVSILLYLLFSKKPF